MNRKAKKKIGLDLRMLGTTYGIGRYSLELARKILEIDKENIYYLFVRESKLLRECGLIIPENAVVVTADYSHYSFAEQLYYPFLLKSFKLDLVHFFNFNVPLLYNRPFVVTIHDMTHHQLPGNKKTHFLHRLAYKLIIKRAIFRSRGVITVSNAAKRDILTYYQASPDKIFVIYEAAQTLAVTDSEINSVRQRFGINKDYLVFVGVLERKKNLLNLAKALDILKQQLHQNIQLVLAGSPDPHYPEIAQQLRQIKYAKDLVLTGPVSEKEKFALYQGAKAFVSASLYEGFGLPGVEAMSLGVPLIVANTEVFNEIYDNGAVYFDANDPGDIAQKINFLLGDHKYRELIARNAFSRSKMFSWEDAARQTINLYNQCV